MDELTDLAADLVSVPSHEDEAAAGDAIESWLRKETDADVRRDDAGNVLARKGTGEESLALVGHHDVVPPDEGQVREDGYVVRTEDGRLYGRGAADMKGAVAAAMCAFRDADPAEGLELVFASFVGEEVGGTGARHAIEAGFAPDYAVVGEGSTNYSGPDVTDVVVSSNRAETGVLADAYAGEAERSFTEDAQAVFEALSPTWFVGHGVERSVVASEEGTDSVAVPAVSDPELTTSSGDHFNAGLGLARIAGLPPAAAVVLGNAVAGYFVRTADQPSLADVRAFVDDYLEKF